MNRGKKKALALLAIAVVVSTTAVFAADNTGLGDIAGVDADLADSNTFALSSTTLGLVKRAFLAADGSPLTSGASIPKGTQVKFMIYINNNTAVAVDDISVQDALVATFGYQANTIKDDNSVANCAAAACTPAEEAAIFAAVDATAVLTDAAGDDVASYTPTTIDLGNANEITNAQLDIAASSVWAVSFTVTMQ